EIDKAAGEIFKACDGMGTDEEAIFSALKGKSRGEGPAIKEAYKERTGENTDERLKDELDGKDYDLARAQMSADRAAAPAETPRHAADGMGTDEATIQSTLRGLKPEQRARVEEEFKRRSGGQTLDEMLNDEMSGSDLKIALAEKDGDKAAADAVRLD